LPCTEVTPCDNPLITANPYPALAGGECRGKPSASSKKTAMDGPVTTDPFGVRLRCAERKRQSMTGATRGPSGDRGEGIVCPSGNRGPRRSSDLHEWRNDLGTVSTRDSAKLHYE
jgi:hypothetical protein